MLLVRLQSADVRNGVGHEHAPGPPEPLTETSRLRDSSWRVVALGTRVAGYEEAPHLVIATALIRELDVVPRAG